MLVIETGQALALGMLLMAFGALIVGYTNMRTTQLSVLCDALQAINAALGTQISTQAARIQELQGTVSSLETRVSSLEDRNYELIKENHRLMEELVGQLRKEPTA